MKRLLSIINLKTFIIVGVAVASTFFSIRYDITANFPLTLIATAVIFPIVFSISGAYKRRETALNHYADLKAHGKAIFYAARDWPEKPSASAVLAIREELELLLDACRTLFMSPKRDMTDNALAVYASFSRLSRLSRTELRQKGMPAGEVSRTNQFLSKMLVSFEKIKHVFQYRTPRTLRAFADIFILLLPLLYGPYFAHLAKDYSSPYLSYIVPVLFAFVLVSLDNIQTHLENPFDQVGEDDVTINVEKFGERLRQQACDMEEC